MSPPYGSWGHGVCTASNFSCGQASTAVRCCSTSPKNREQNFVCLIFFSCCWGWGVIWCRAKYCSRINIYEVKYTIYPVFLSIKMLVVWLPLFCILIPLAALFHLWLFAVLFLGFDEIYTQTTAGSVRFFCARNERLSGAWIFPKMYCISVYYCYCFVFILVLVDSMGAHDLQHHNFLQKQKKTERTWIRIKRDWCYYSILS